MINKQLLDYQYYLDRMSMFMNESIGFQQRVKILYSLLIDIDNFYNQLFEMYDVRKIINNNFKNFDASSDELLNRLGAIFNCSRNLTIKWGNSNNPISEADLDGSLKYITLSNFEYYIYIRSAVLKAFYDGSREYLLKYYNRENQEEVGIWDISKSFEFYYLSLKNSEGTGYSGPSANVRIYWLNATAENNFTTNLKYMFLNGLLTIESIGVNYERFIQQLIEVSIWDNAKWTDLEFEPQIKSIWG